MKCPIDRGEMDQGDVSNEPVWICQTHGVYRSTKCKGCRKGIAYFTWSYVSHAPAYCSNCQKLIRVRNLATLLNQKQNEEFQVVKGAHAELARLERAITGAEKIGLTGVARKLKRERDEAEKAFYGV